MQRWPSAGTEGMNSSAVIGIIIGFGLQEKARKLFTLMGKERDCRRGKHYIPLGFRGRTYIIGLAGGIMNSVAHVNVFFDDHVRRQLLSPAGRLRAYPIPDLTGRISLFPEDQPCREPWRWISPHILWMIFS